jgi:hypothetical protein
VRSIYDDALSPKTPKRTPMPTPAPATTTKIILLAIRTAASVVLALHFGTSRSYRRRYYQERTGMGGEDPQSIRARILCSLLSLQQQQQQQQ